MEDEEVREILENSNNSISVYPSDLREGVESGKFPLIAPGSEIRFVDFDETGGMYGLMLENGEYYEICAVCGEIQPMNMKAMESFDPNIAKEMDGVDIMWDNNTCEQRHPPFEPEWVSG